MGHFTKWDTFSVRKPKMNLTKWDTSSFFSSEIGDKTNENNGNESDKENDEEKEETEEKKNFG